MASIPGPPRQRIETFTIPQIVDLAARGLLRVPAVARPYVWNAAQNRELFDSLLHGYPIGTFVFLEGPQPAATVTFGPLVIDAPASDRAYTVVDGHQRIAALVAALLPEAAGLDDAAEMYLSIADERFVQASRGRAPSQAIPVRDAFSTTALLNWWSSHEELDPTSSDVIDRLTRAIREYAIPVYIVTTGDAGQTYEMFMRINTAGQSLRRSEIFQAAFAGDNNADNLTGVARTLASSGFGIPSDESILDSLLAIRGGDIRRNVGDEFARDEDRATWLDHTRNALNKSVRFLVAQGVPQIDLAPTTTVIPVLAAFFHLHPEPAPWNQRLVARWLWRTWARGAGGRPVSDIRQAVLAVLPHKLGHDDAPSEYLGARRLLMSIPGAVPPLPRRAWRINTAAGRLALLTLAAAHPLGPSGTPVDIRAELTDGVRSIPVLTVDRHRDVAARAFWPHGSPALSTITSMEVRHSHLVSEDAARALRAGNDDGFLDARRTLLHEAMEALLSNRMELGASVRPPIADLVESAERG